MTSIIDIKIISIHTLSDLGVLSNLIGSLSLANEHYAPPKQRGLLSDWLKFYTGTQTLTERAAEIVKTKMASEGAIPTLTLLRRLF